MFSAWMNTETRCHGASKSVASNGRSRILAAANALTVLLFVTIFTAALHFSTFARANEKSVVSFMNDLARSAIQANQTVSRSDLEKIIRDNVDVETIGDYSLGSYLGKLPKSEFEKYYDSVTNFMARYAATQSKYYQVENVEFYRPKHHRDNTITLKSKITMSSGTSYRVKWKIIQTDGQYKVLDASIFGFWLSPFQRRLFQSYVRENNHDVHALVAVLAQ